MRHVLVVRLDSLGDMLICGPAIRAVAAQADRVTVLAGPGGAAAAAMLPGVDDVLVWACPWIVADPPAVDPSEIRGLVGRIAALRVDEALVLTSFHQSSLPVALVLRMAGVARVCAVSTDYAGALLDERLGEPADAPEPMRMLAIAAGAGFGSPADDDGRLRVRRPAVYAGELPKGPFVVVHPGVSAPARAYPVHRWVESVRALTEAGWPVVVTGSTAEKDITADAAAAGRAGMTLDLGGQLDLEQLAAVLDVCACLVVANTGPAHLGAALGTPVVSLFAPVVPARRWVPYATPVVVLGDQDAACRGSRARVCPVPGHPCLDHVTPGEILAAVQKLTLHEPAASERTRGGPCAS